MARESPLACETAIAPSTAQQTRRDHRLPLAVISGTWLWHRQNRGFLLSGGVLTTMTTVGVSVIAGIVFEAAADPTITLTPLPMLAVVTLIGLWLLVAYLRNVRRGHEVEGTRVH
jgi:hypothetical protein